MRLLVGVYKPGGAWRTSPAGRGELITGCSTRCARWHYQPGGLHLLCVPLRIIKLYRNQFIVHGHHSRHRHRQTTISQRLGSPFTHQRKVFAGVCPRPGRCDIFDYHHAGFDLQDKQMHPAIHLVSTSCFDADFLADGTDHPSAVQWYRLESRHLIDCRQESRNLRNRRYLSKQRF